VDRTTFAASPSAPPAYYTGPEADLLVRLGTGESGLAAAVAQERLRTGGPNRLATASRRRGWRLLAGQFANPTILILIVATILAIALGDLADGIIILIIIGASGLLGFWQEHRAGNAVDELIARVQIHSEVLRDGREVPIAVDEIVPGDIVVLRAGDVIPADCRVLWSRNLLVDEAALTGESFPVEKAPARPLTVSPLAERINCLFMGTHVVSGEGRAVVSQTGTATEYAAVYQRLAEADVTTSFEKGMTRFGLLLVRAMVVLVTGILVVNLALDRPFVESVLFSLALAVGLTPQLLPAIVAVSLAAGARRMAAAQVIVKRLDAIEDFGGMTTLCTDKTGTLTAGAIRVERAVDVTGQPSDSVLRLAQLNAALQRGFANPIDDAIIRLAVAPIEATLLDELPYDFTRKLLSVLIEQDGDRTVITKGALSHVVGACTQAMSPAGPLPLGQVRADLDGLAETLSAQGFRILGVAAKRMPGGTVLTGADESGLTLYGLLALADPVKDDAAAAIAELAGLGISLRVVTGDNRLAAAYVADRVGLTGALLDGATISALTDDQLSARVLDTSVFAEVEPLHKERIVKALQRRGEVVGFLGDGINDSPALHAADIGISVDRAVDVAKQSASIVLTGHSLRVIADGVRLGRQTFANTLKYIRVTISANFGNMLSMAAASAFLPFLPLLPRQILLLNLLSDIPATTIATDAVDPEQLAAPRRWELRSLRSFMITFGLISSVFDLATFAVLRIGFGADAATFRSGWFVESTLTELAIMLILRTARPAIRSRPSRPLLLSSVAVAALALALPYTPAVAGELGLAPLPGSMVAALALLTAAYVVVNETAKRWHRID
jgi:Mg2+-importing ATPase